MHGVRHRPRGTPATYNKNGHLANKGGRDRGTARILGGHSCRLPPDETRRLLQPACALSRLRPPVPVLVGATGGAPVAARAAIDAIPRRKRQATKNPESLTPSGFVWAMPWNSVVPKRRIDGIEPKSCEGLEP